MYRERKKDFQKNDIYYDLKHQKIGDLLIEYWSDNNFSTQNCSISSFQWKKQSAHFWHFAGGGGGY